MKKRRFIWGILLAGLLLLSISSAVSAQTQQGTNPIVLNPNRTIDNLEQLPAAAAARPDAITIFNAGVPKYFWVNNFGGRSTDYLEWTVQSNLTETTDYYAWLHVSANKGTQFKLTVTKDGISTETTYTKPNDGWEVAEFGTLKIPSGVSTIRLTKVTAANQNCSVKGLDIIRASDKAAYLGRVTDYRNSGAAQKIAFSEAGYGLFFQYGVWGYPQTGPKKSMEDSTNDFDVDDFVAMLKTTDTRFVIWSITWWQYRMQMPVQSVDTIMGNSSLTTERNLISEIAAKCKQEGIQFYLYYHQGMQQEPTWKAKQNWPDASFTNYGVGDRSTFFNNWESVITEIGQTLGTNLDGWFFDDGCVYYPAPFERLAQATKAGNPNRLVSYNAWHGTKITEFQDMIFGEGTWGEAQDTTNGIYNSGKEKDLLQVGMPMINNGNWGITSQNETIDLTVNPSDLIQKVSSAKARKVPIALNLKMWEDGTIGSTTFDALIQLKNALGDNPPPSPVTMVNNDDPSIQYSGAGWVRSGGNYGGYYQNDCNYTKTLTPAHSVEYTFTGTGIGVIGIRETWSANAKVFIDGAEAGRAVFTGSPKQTQYEGFSKQDLTYGQHTIRLEFESAGAEAHLDAFKVYDNRTSEPGNYPVTGISISSSAAEMAPNGTLQLSVNVKPQYATNKQISWSVTDENGNATELAAVDQNGLLTGASNGTGVVKVRAASAENPAIFQEIVIQIRNLPERTTVFGNSSDITREGQWTLRAGSKSTDSVMPGAKATYSFTGNAIEWYGVTGYDHGRANIYIDGTYVTNVDCYSADRQSDVLLFRSDKLASGNHTITIEVDSLKNDYAQSFYVEIYRLIYEKNAVDLSILEDAIAQAQQLPNTEEYYTTSSWGALQAAILQGNGILTSADTTMDDVSAAVNAIQTAVSQLAQRGNAQVLNGVVNSYKDLDLTVFTDASVQVFSSALSHAQSLLETDKAADTTEDVMIQAAQDLISAAENLVLKVDRSNLQEAVTYADQLLTEESKYIPDAVANLKSVLEAAKTLLADDQATQQQIDDKTTDMVNALAGMLLAGNKDSLQMLVSIYSKLTESKYMPSSWSPFSDALQAASTVLQDVNAVQEQIDQVYLNLMNAQSALIRVADRTALNAAISMAQSVLANPDLYVPSTIAQLSAMRDSASQVAQDANATQEQVNSARQSLNAQLLAVRRRAVTISLNNAIKYAKNLNEAKYTKKSYLALQSAITASADTAGNPEITQEQADQQLQLLLKSISSLVRAVPAKKTTAVVTTAPEQPAPANTSQSQTIAESSPVAAVTTQRETGQIPQNVASTATQPAAQTISQPAADQNTQISDEPVALAGNTSDTESENKTIVDEGTPKAAADNKASIAPKEKPLTIGNRNTGIIAVLSVVFLVLLGAFTIYRIRKINYNNRKNS